MDIEASSAYPVKTLRELATSLEAAVLVCTSGATPGAVHRVRTRTRRIEAQLLLLAQITHLPCHKQQSKKLRKHLKRLLRFVSPIGDIDVQCELIAGQSHTADDRASKRLLSHLNHKRARKTPALHHQLRRSSAKISRALGSLLAALGPAELVVLPAAELIRVTQQWFGRQHCSVSTNKQLHATRKAARLARYMTENAPGSTEARELARTFEAMQQAGGEWHDWFQLAFIAGKRLRKNNPLLKMLRQKCLTGAEIYRGNIPHSYRNSR